MGASKKALLQQDVKERLSFVIVAGYVNRVACFFIILMIECQQKMNWKEEKAMDNRFEFIEKNGLMEGTRIIVDKTTGVQYLLAHWTNIGGLTVLVDKDGKPLLDPRYAK